MKNFRELLYEKFEVFADDDISRWALDNTSEIVKAQSQGHQMVAIAGGSNAMQWELMSLNDFDKKWVKEYKLKSGEHILRLVTRGGHITPLVKLNSKKGLLYFLTDKANEEDIVEFESKGTKLRYIRVIKGSGLDK